MSTDPFDNIGFNQEISQSTYVELITATRTTGKAIRTICQEIDEEIVCDEGPSPNLRLRDLAYKKQKTAKPKTRGRLSAKPQKIDQSQSKQIINYNLDADTSLRAQRAAIHASAVNKETHDLIKNYYTDDILKPQLDELFTCGDDRLVNDSDFDVNRNGWAGMTLETSISSVSNFATLETAGTEPVSIQQSFTDLTPGSTVGLKILIGPLVRVAGDPGFVSSSSASSIRVEYLDSAGNVLRDDGIAFNNELETFISDIPEDDLLKQVVPVDGILVVRITIPITYSTIGYGVFKRKLSIDRVMLCEKIPALQSCLISNVNATLKWSGIPRQPVNIIRSFIQYKVRDPDDASKFAIINQLGGDSFHSSGCDFWTQRTDGGNYQSNPLTPPNPDTLLTVSDGDLVAIPPNENMIWAVPDFSSTGFNNFLRTEYIAPHLSSPTRRASGDPICAKSIDELGYKNCVVESVTAFFLINRIDPPDPGGESAACGPDPAVELNVILSYIRNNTNKEFTQIIHKNSLYQQEVADKGDWSNISGYGNAVPGTVARWEAFEFVLDTTANSGLDQCTVGTGPGFVATGSGELKFSKFGQRALGFFRERCVPIIYIETEQNGLFSNEIQSIILPNPGSGQYYLTITVDGEPQTTGAIEFDADADIVKNAIIATLGVTNDDLAVTGEGTEDSPFLVEFKGIFSASDIDLITADATELVGTGLAYFTTIRDGTRNERQTLSRVDGANQPYKLGFNGTETINIAYDATINEVQSALDAIVGVGNISVSGLITNRNIKYDNTLYFDFIGVYSGVNVPQMTVSSPTAPGSYSITTNWSGGIGTIETQDLIISASSGTFTITITNPYSTGTYPSTSTTDPISYDASALAIKQAILEVADWLDNSDIAVIKPEDNRWRFTFGGALLGVNMTQMSANSNNLSGGEIDIRTIQNGSGTSEIQRIILSNVTGGFFQLRIVHPITGITGTSSSISYIATNNAVKNAILDTGLFTSDDVTVSGSSPEWVVVFRKSIGNIARMGVISDFLVCDSAAITPVPPGPYKYELPKPGPGDPLPEESPLQPLRDSANFYSQTVLQRYLFDPNTKVNNEQKTLRQIVLMRGYKPDLYTPYLRTCDNRLLDADYSMKLQTQQNYLIIEKTIDSEQERARILKHISSHRSILPMRFSWDCAKI